MASSAAEPITIRPSSDGAGPLKPIAHAAYLAQIERERSLLNACERSVPACDPAAVGDDELVGPGDGNPAFEAHWDWLRDALIAAKDANAADRARLFRNAYARLDADAAEAAAAPTAESSAQLAQARLKADAILAQPEFRPVEQNSWLWLKIAAFFTLLDKLFSGAVHLLPQSSALGEVLEWGVLLLAAIAFFLWAWRSRRQQRVLIAAAQGPVTAWQQESERWAERAQAEAANANWREAVHCLYWAAIVMLEGQRLWRQNRTRTPREYLVLLEPGSARRGTLTGLTRLFERIWYGLRPAAESDYQQARLLLERLRAG
jgi:hypothetical protein